MQVYTGFEVGLFKQRRNTHIINVKRYACRIVDQCMQNICSVHTGKYNKDMHSIMKGSSK